MRRFVKILDRTHAAAIAIVVEHTLVALAGIGRAQNENLGRKFNESVGIHRRFVDVHDACLCRGIRIDGIARPSAQSLIGADLAKFMILGKWRAIGKFKVQCVGHNDIPWSVLAG